MAKPFILHGFGGSWYVKKRWCLLIHGKPGFDVGEVWVFCTEWKPMLQICTFFVEPKKLSVQNGSFRDGEVVLAVAVVLVVEVVSMRVGSIEWWSIHMSAGEKTGVLPYWQDGPGPLLTRWPLSLLWLYKTIITMMITFLCLYHYYLFHICLLQLYPPVFP